MVKKKKRTAIDMSKEFLREQMEDLRISQIKGYGITPEGKKVTVAGAVQRATDRRRRGMVAATTQVGDAAATIPAASMTRGYSLSRGLSTVATRGLPMSWSMPGPRTQPAPKDKIVTPPVKTKEQRAFDAYKAKSDVVLDRQQRFATFMAEGKTREANKEATYLAAGLNPRAKLTGLENDPNAQTAITQAESLLKSITTGKAKGSEASVLEQAQEIIEPFIEHAKAARAKVKAAGERERKRVEGGLTRQLGVLNRRATDETNSLKRMKDQLKTLRGRKAGWETPAVKASERGKDSPHANIKDEIKELKEDIKTQETKVRDAWDAHDDFSAQWSPGEPAPGEGEMMQDIPAYGEDYEGFDIYGDEGGIPTISTDAEYDALESGMEYIAPDGTRRRKA